MLEKEIKEHLIRHGVKQSYIYKEIGVSKQNFYKAIRTKNFENPTLKKILEFLGLEIFISVKEKNENNQNQKS